MRKEREEGKIKRVLKDRSVKARRMQCGWVVAGSCSNRGQKQGMEFPLPPPVLRMENPGGDTSVRKAQMLFFLIYLIKHFYFILEYS